MRCSRDERESDAEERRFAEASATALDRLWQLLVVLSSPVQQACDEVLGEGLQQWKRIDLAQLRERQSMICKVDSGGGGAGDIA
jgi:hypothetical protein